MELYIHIPTNLEYFDLLNEGYLLSTSNDREIANFIIRNYKWELADTLSPQYDVNFSSIREIKKKFWKDFFDKISGIYYGSDNCEYLVATETEIRQAWEKFLEFNKKYPPFKTRSFTYVSPYVGNLMLEKISKTLDYLNNIKSKNPIEVVFNDLGVLSLLNKKFTNLKPIAGRLILKTLKTPLIDTYGYEAHPAGESIKNLDTKQIQEIRDRIVTNQKEFYSSSELGNEFFTKFLKRLWIKNIWIDYIENREKLYYSEKSGWMKLDIYYPWSLVFTWRLCDTCGIDNPTKWMYATDDICPRICRQYDIFYNIKTSWYYLTQRWNSWYRSQINLDYLNLEKTDINSRFIFAPFITV